MLGFEEDERDFAIAAAILKKLGIKKIRLLTNNPQKIVSLKKHGIAVAERVPLVVKPGRHNHAYLNAKAKKSATCSRSMCCICRPGDVAMRGGG